MTGLHRVLFFAWLASSGILACSDGGASDASAQDGGDADPGRDGPEGDVAGDRGVASTRVVFVAGGPSHGPGEHEYFAGAMLLAKMLEQTERVTSVVARDGWPLDETALDGSDAIVLLTDGNVGHPLLQGNRMEVLGAHTARGAGLVCIHWSVHFPEAASARVLPWLGGHYSDDISVNPTWLARFQALPDHPVARGVAAFELQDEWYYNMRFAADATRLTPILRAVPPDSTRFTADAAAHPGRAETVAWAFERAGGGRSFGFTGAHFHRNWGHEGFRRLAVNAILWTAGREVPAGGAPVAMDSKVLDENLDMK